MAWTTKLLTLTAALLVEPFLCLLVLRAATPPKRAIYVDARVCAGCHRQIAEDYARTGMGRSFFRPGPSTTLENYATTDRAPGPGIYHALSDTYFSMALRDGQYFQRRWQLGFDGKETNIEELKIDYVLGSGNHARSYLHRTPRGTLIELPLGWYSEDALAGLGRSGSGHWGMSPGSDSDHPRTRRFVSYKCMFCHNGIPQIPAGHEAPDTDPIVTGDLPEGIDCQRCHGPGGKHVRTVETRGSTLVDIRASIVNPGRLSPKLRMEICMQCHLETSSGRIPASIVRFNRGPFSFVPGEPLDAFMLTFDHAPGTGHDDKFEAVSSVYRLRQSRCFLESRGRLTCDTCHNPHKVLRGNEAASHYSAVCLECHSQRQGSLPALESLVASGKHSAASDCTTCHMPKRRPEDTPGMVMTDHLIQRRPPGRNLLAELREPVPEEYHGEVVPYYPSPLPQTPANALYLAMAQVALGNNLQAGLPDFARETARQKPSEAAFYTVLGDAWQNARDLQAAVAAYEHALQLNPNSVAILRTLAIALTAQGSTVRASGIFNRAAQLGPSDPITWYRFGMLDFRMGQIPGALEKIRKAIDLDPSLPEQSRSLGEVLTKAGLPELALAAFRDALRTDPYDDAAWDLTGRVLIENGEAPAAIYAFQKSTRLRPSYGPYLHDFALALIRADRFDEAQERAEAAVKADPALADTHDLLAGLFARKRQMADAAREYRRSLELRPDSSRTHLLLGTVLAAQGDASGASEHLREAAKSSDAAIVQQAAQALRQLGAAK